MSRLRRLVDRRVASDALVLRLAQGACFAAGPALLVVALLAVARLAATPGEVLLGVLGGAAAALLLVVLGMVLPLAARGPAA
jgi:hypothetical protein